MTAQEARSKALQVQEEQTKFKCQLEEILNSIDNILEMIEDEVSRGYLSVDVDEYHAFYPNTKQTLKLQDLGYILEHFSGNEHTDAWCNIQW